MEHFWLLDFRDTCWVQKLHASSGNGGSNAGSIGRLGCEAGHIHTHMPYFSRLPCKKAETNGMRTKVTDLAWV
eukprot:1160633-Pelagomonas_calceolata.AAC.5